MEALQMTKYAVHNTPIYFTTDILTPEAELTTDVTTDVLAVSITSQDQDIQCENAMDQVVWEIDDKLEDTEVTV
jgi:hypothetical protein